MSTTPLVPPVLSAQEIFDAEQEEAIQKILHLRVGLQRQHAEFRSAFGEVDTIVDDAYDRAIKVSEDMSAGRKTEVKKRGLWGIQQLEHRETPAWVWDNLCEELVAKMSITPNQEAALENASFQRWMQHLYTYVVRARTPIVFLISMCLFFVMFTGFLMQMFCVFFGSPVITWKEELALFLLPFAIVVVGIVCEQMVHLVFDAFDYPPLSYHQAAVATMLKIIHSVDWKIWKLFDEQDGLVYRHDEVELEKIMRSVDKYMWFSIVGIPWVFAFGRLCMLGTAHIAQSVIEGYVFGCLCSSAVVTIVQLVCVLVFCELVEGSRNMKCKRKFALDAQGQELKGLKRFKAIAGELVKEAKAKRSKKADTFRRWLDHMRKNTHLTNRKSTAQKVVESHMEAQAFNLRHKIKGDGTAITAMDKYQHFFSNVQQIAMAVPVEAMGMSEATKRFSEMSKMIENGKGMFLFQMYGYVKKDHTLHYCPWQLNIVVFGLWFVMFLGILGAEKSQSGSAAVAHISNPIFAGGAVFFTVFAMSMTWHLRVRQMIGATYGLVVTFLGLLALSTLSSGHAQASLFQMENMKPIMQAAAYHNNSLDLNASWTGITRPTEEDVAGKAEYLDRYPLCNLKWGAAGARLGPLDLAVFAFGVYEQNTTDAGHVSTPNDGFGMYEQNENTFAQTKAYLARSFPGRKVEFINGTGYYEFPRWMHFRIIDPTGVKHTSVFAVKGTSTRLDLYFDTAVYNTITMLRKMQNWLPVLMILPRSTIQWMMNALSFSHHLEDTAFARLEDAANERMFHHEYQNDSWVVTGHSLGGMFAQIVSSRLGKPSLVWSSPGVTFSKERMGIQLQNVKRNVVVIVPDHDAVPHADFQAGVVQRIECREKDGAEMGNPLACHGVDKSACEIWRVCGDTTRDYSATCSKYVDPEFLGKDFPEDDVGSF